MSGETVREAAERRLAEQESRDKAERLEALERDESARRDREERERREAEIRAAARREAAKLSDKRTELVRAVEDSAAQLVRNIRDLENLDTKHRSKLKEAGEQLPWNSLRPVIAGWMAFTVGEYVRAHDPYVGTNPRPDLASRDPLTPATTLPPLRRETR